MAFNNGFPATYPQYYSYQQIPNMMQPVQQAQQVQTNARMVEIVPVDTEEIAAGWPVGIGQTQAMMAKDDSFIAFKSVSVNGQTDFVVYTKRPPAPPEPKLDLGNYVTWDKLEERLANFAPAMRRSSKEKEASE